MYETNSTDRRHTVCRSTDRHVFVPESIGLSTAGIRTLGVLIAIIIALVTEPLPIGITCMLGIALMVIFGVSPTVSDALSGYTNHILFLYWFPSVFQRPSPKCPFPNGCWWF